MLRDLLVMLLMAGVVAAITAVIWLVLCVPVLRALPRCQCCRHDPLRGCCRCNRRR